MNRALVLGWMLAASLAGAQTATKSDIAVPT